jgi:hypothetical protein
MTDVDGDAEQPAFSVKFKELSVVDANTGEELAGFTTLDFTDGVLDVEDYATTAIVRCNRCHSLVFYPDITGHLHWHDEHETRVLSHIMRSLSAIEGELDRGQE